MAENVRVVEVNPTNVADRIGVCWGLPKNWRHLKVVRQSREWLEKVNALFNPTTFIAYIDKVPVGMMEFVPQKLIKIVGLCPCRANPEKNEIESRYILGKRFENCLFISCLWVRKDYQRKGVGKALLNYFLSSEAFRNSSGALVYVSERDEGWDKHIHWPAGPKEFYIRAGFTLVKTLSKPVGYMLYHKRTGVET